MVETENVKSLNDLAREVHITGEDLSFRGVKADLPEGMKGKCVFWDGKVRTESKPFPIIVQGEGGKHPPTTRVRKHSCYKVRKLSGLSDPWNDTAYFNYFEHFFLK